MTREEATTKLKWFLESNLIEDISGCEGLEEAIGMAIEALSNASNALNTLDCVSRTMALTEIRHLYPSAPSINFRGSLARWSEKNKQYIECEEVIKRLPSAQPEQGWIPVSERLPEEYEYVLLCDREPEPDENTDYSQMAVGWLEDGQICCWDDRATRNEFVAWMPLPEPYKERREE